MLHHKIIETKLTSVREDAEENYYTEGLKNSFEKSSIYEYTDSGIIFKSVEYKDVVFNSNEIDRYWVEIPYYNHNYLLSYSGKVASTHKSTFRLLKVKVAGGYPFVCLSLHGKGITNYVHRLMAEAFVDNPAKHPEVNHLNGIKSDYRVTNLEWVSHQENCLHAYNNGLSKKEGRSVVNTETKKVYSSIKEAAEDCQINYSTLRNSLSRMGGGSLPFIYSPEEQKE